MTRPEATGRLTIDLTALRSNYRRLAVMAGNAETAGVIKADGYGIGATEAAQALSLDGCRTFFVATPDEARDVRACVPEAVIYVLDGLLPGTAPVFAEIDARPVLGSMPEIENWAGWCKAENTRFAAAIHIDTGMNRLGLSPGETIALATRDDLLRSFDPALVMSHLACADEPDNPMTQRQAEMFDELRSGLPVAPASLANSAGILASPRYHYDLVRPGIALYGGAARVGETNTMDGVVRLEGRIAQLRTVKAGATIGYGAAGRAARDTPIATVTIGYADGFFRTLGGCDTGAAAYIGDYRAPLIGRVSMDLITIDLSAVPPGLVERGAMVELIGPHAGVDDVAAGAGTIGYEVLTSLGRRVERHYLGREA